jgi:dipeptidyl-peptidase-4
MRCLNLAIVMAVVSLSCAAPSKAAATAKPAPAVGPQDAAHAAGKLTLDDVFDLFAQLKLHTGTSLGWQKDGARYLAVEDDPQSKAKRIFAVDAASGSKTALFDPSQMQSAFAALPGIDADTAKDWSTRTNFTLTDAKDGVLLNESNDLFFARLGGDKAVRLTNDPREEVGETLSPDGRWLAFVADWNLHVVPTDGSQPERALTSAGDENHLYGRLDWVYQEEVYGRGNFGAMWWSPDSKRLAYLIIDETQVPTYTVTDHRETHPKNEQWRYPKAGDPNPKAVLAIVDVAGGAPTMVDLSSYQPDEFLIVRVGWTPDSKQVVYQVQNRIQSWIDIDYADPKTGKTTRILRDTSGPWVAPTSGPYWIDDGARFLFESERDGYAHLYLYGKDGKLQNRVTQGPWEVDSVDHYDAQSGFVYFMADKEDSKGEQLYRCKLDGQSLERVTKGEGTHTVSFSHDGAFFLDTFSSAREWPRLSLCKSDGSLVREIEKVDGKPASDKGVVPPEFVKVKTKDGFEMEAMLFKPPHFDATKKYPVMCHTYSGPHAPKVLDRALSFDALYHEMLAQEGYLVWICDNRSASGKGLVSTQGIYKNFGAQELADLEQGLDWLVAQGFADPARIGIWGWSFGGYETAYALTHSKRFKIGIAGAPVTDWRLYDSIYTERYMDLPQHNPEGYAKSSILEAAANLSGKLLICHGVIDENVHMQNTLQFAQRLQEAGILFDMMLYPGNRHPVVAPKQKKHLYSLMAHFIETNL